MNARAICPCCGYDLVADTPVVLNDYSMNGPGYPLLYKGEMVKLTVSEAIVSWALLKAYPDQVASAVLMERLGADGDSNLVEVHICRIRKKLRDLGVPKVIQTVRYYKAYTWVPEGGSNEISKEDEDFSIASQLLRSCFDRPATRAGRSQGG